MFLSINRLNELINEIDNDEKPNLDYKMKFSYMKNLLEKISSKNFESKIDSIYNNPKSIKVVTHNDAHQHNVLINTEIEPVICKFIDYEHVCLSDLGEDLVTTFLFLGCLYEFDFLELLEDRYFKLFKDYFIAFMKKIEKTIEEKDIWLCYLYCLCESTSSGLAFQCKFFQTDSDYNYVTTRYKWALLLDNILSKIDN